MNTFYFIIEKYFNITKTFTRENRMDIQDIFFLILLHKKYSIKTKLHFFESTIKNIFMNDTGRELFINRFGIIQKLYFAFSKLAYIYKLKKSKTIVDYDLQMTPLNIKNKSTICIYQNNCKYLFNVNELIQIINKALSNNYGFFSEPITIKNPYNNIPLNKSNLYNIYFHLREKLFVVPELFHKFFISNFDIVVYKDEYDYLIREHSINNYTKYTFIDTLHEDALTMLNDYNHVIGKNKRIIIDPDFSKKKLVDIMRPYLKLYYISKLSLIDNKRKTAKITLHKKLVQFNKFNYLFGRKYITIQSTSNINTLFNKCRKQVCNFNDKSMCFYNKERDFMTSHIYDEENEDT